MRTADATVFSLEAAAHHDGAALGGKGESLARIAGLGLAVPPAFILSTAVCRDYLMTAEVPAAVWEEVDARLAELERIVGRDFGDRDTPLLLSVRSGAAVSMPGMMDTILNVGLNAANLEGFARWCGDPAAADDAYARLLRGFAESVPEIEAGDRSVPEDPRCQLRQAIEAVFRSWAGPRAARYRRFSGIDDGLGTAVVVQAMVFGNLADHSGTGVAFTRDPATGAPGLFGDFLAAAQGDDVVGGEHEVSDLDALRRFAPDAAADLAAAARLLERSYEDLCDIEFTVERGKLFILQARRGQRTPPAAVRIALDLAEEGMIDWDEALRRVSPEALVRLLEPVLDPAAERRPIGRGVPASPGAAVGVVALSPAEAEQRAGAGEEVVLVRSTTNPRDISGMIAARGVITASGGRTSHAAVVARGMSLPAVCGVGGLRVESDLARFGEVEVRPGDLVSIDGDRGEVYAGALPVVAAPLDPRVERLLELCDARRRVSVFADGPAAEWADDILPLDAPRVSDPDDLAGAGPGPLVIAPADPEVAVALVARAARTGRDLVFRVPEVWPPALHELPPGPWVGIAASAGGHLAARLLAARVEPATPSEEV